MYKRQGEHRAVGRAHSGDPAPGSGDGGGGLPGVQPGPAPDGGPQQGGRREDGLDLGVLRVVDAAGESGGAVRFEVGGAVDAYGTDSGRRLALREGVEGGEGFG